MANLSSAGRDDRFLRKKGDIRGEKWCGREYADYYFWKIQNLFFLFLCTTKIFFKRNKQIPNLKINEKDTINVVFFETDVDINI